MRHIAIKMLVGDRARYLGLVFGIMFATLLMSQQVSIFIGLMARTASQINDLREVDVMVMDPQVRYIDVHVLLINIHPGEFAPSGTVGTPLMVLGDTSVMHVRVEISLQTLGRAGEPMGPMRGTVGSLGESDCQTLETCLIVNVLPGCGASRLG